jgi:hypothetical protein
VIVFPAKETTAIVQPALPGIRYLSEDVWDSLRTDDASIVVTGGIKKKNAYDPFEASIPGENEDSPVKPCIVDK